MAPLVARRYCENKKLNLPKDFIKQLNFDLEDLPNIKDNFQIQGDRYIPRRFDISGNQDHATAMFD